MNTILKTTVCALTLWGASATFSQAGQDIPISDLPKKVTAALMRTAPDAKILDAEKEMKKGTPYYDIDYKVGDEKRTIKVWEDGTVKEDKKDR